ncbi:MAG TPA: GNAT family N-acetyltransferase [bacterium]|nr:GNAT family N-acetyltransferase [bacterium]
MRYDILNPPVGSTLRQVTVAEGTRVGTHLPGPRPGQHVGAHLWADFDAGSVAASSVDARPPPASPELLQDILWYDTADRRATSPGAVTRRTIVLQPLPVLLDIPEELHGPRVLVRPLRPEDAPETWAAIEESREHLAAWLPWVDQLRSPDDERAVIAHMRARWVLREDLTVGIFDRETGRLLGGTGLHRINWSVRAFEVGYWVRLSAQGRGYVTEAVQLVTRLAFETLSANRVEIRVDPRNVRSRRIPERLGFVLEGTLRRSALDASGTPSDRLVFALVREDYARLPWTATDDRRPA